MANTQIKKKLKSLNPNKATLFKTGKKGKITSVKFIKWLSKHKDSDKLIPRLYEIEKEYKDRLNLYLSTVPMYWKKLNIGTFLKDFDWKQKEY